MLGVCQVLCGPPSPLAHAALHIATGDGKGDGTGGQDWRGGARLSYQCDPGYGGSPEAECGLDGKWTFLPAGGKCEYLGCGPLDSFLAGRLGPDWASSMSTNDQVNVTSLDSGFLATFACRPGYAGSAFAACVRGRWRLGGACEVVHTSIGCRCKAAWHACTGWSQGNCIEVTLRSTTKASTRCEIAPGSCPPSAPRPWWHREYAWDYCSHEARLADAGHSIGDIAHSPANGNATHPAPEPKPKTMGQVVALSTVAAAATVGVCALALWVAWRCIAAARGSSHLDEHARPHSPKATRVPSALNAAEPDAPSFSAAEDLRE